MDNIINFDNAATTFPKPEEVKKAALYAMNNTGGNAGRGGHKLAMKTSAMVYSARQAAADFFHAQPENVVFTLNCTHALNTAIKGLIKPGCHVVTSSIEHNSVIRPLVALSKKGIISLSVARVYDDDEQTIDAFKNAVTDKTTLIVCTAAGNVTGQILPVRQIAEICASRKICFVVDGAQACGVIPLTLDDGINVICTSGHKGLYGLSGTGLLITDGKYHIDPLLEGGTGSGSSSLLQPDFLPDCLESGTINTVGIISLKAGIDFVSRITLSRIYEHETMLADYFINLLSDDDRITIYRSQKAHYVPIVSFNVNGVESEQFASVLGEKGFCLRAGFHCAALTHKGLGTTTGTIRFAPSVFNTKSEVKELCSAIKNAL
ncbi:MAG: aminotransferase class V-fold PLP-dependent enzyme [Oscillospiraceae bacterium]|nr:aminotransferase class V-fold PLP-dependent enzyme [Oscillospiraceae bacterium]